MLNGAKQGKRGESYCCLRENISLKERGSPWVSPADRRSPCRHCFPLWKRLGWEFDLDYSGYVIELFPAFEREHPCLSGKFPDTIERTCSACSWVPDDRFQDAISYCFQIELFEFNLKDTACRRYRFYDFRIGKS